VQLFAAGYYRTEGLHWNPEIMQGSPFKYFAYGAAATEVEVDEFTGAYRVRRVDIVHDVGDSLSPMLDIGQIEGAYVQGVGWLTLEELRWDTSDGPHRGRLQTQSASTYKLPSFSEMPEEFHVRLFENAREEGAVYGSKAVGEPPFMLAFSAREAIRDAGAVRPGRPLGRSGLAGDAGGRVLGRPRRAGGRRSAARRSPSAPARPRLDGPPTSPPPAARSIAARLTHRLRVVPSARPMRRAQGDDSNRRGTPWTGWTRCRICGRGGSPP
jgi:hypothetical protein